VVEFKDKVLEVDGELEDVRKDNESLATHMEVKEAEEKRARHVLEKLRAKETQLEAIIEEQQTELDEAREHVRRLEADRERSRRSMHSTLEKEQQSNVDLQRDFDALMDKNQQLLQQVKRLKHEKKTEVLELQEELQEKMVRSEEFQDKTALEHSRIVKHLEKRLQDNNAKIHQLESNLSEEESRSSELEQKLGLTNQKLLRVTGQLRRKELHSEQLLEEVSSPARLRSALPASTYRKERTRTPVRTPRRSFAELPDATLNPREAARVTPDLVEGLHAELERAADRSQNTSGSRSGNTSLSRSRDRVTSSRPTRLSDDALFNALDVDGDGTITSSEWRSAMEKIRSGSDERSERTARATSSTRTSSRYGSVSRDVDVDDEEQGEYRLHHSRAGGGKLLELQDRYRRHKSSRR
jgi:myosin heavy subunit